MQNFSPPPHAASWCAYTTPPSDISDTQSPSTHPSAPPNPTSLPPESCGNASAPEYLPHVDSRYSSPAPAHTPQYSPPAPANARCPDWPQTADDSAAQSTPSTH